MNHLRQSIPEILGQALELPEADRAAFLEVACEGDQRVRQRVERLLVAAPKAAEFLESPAAGCSPTIGTSSGQTIGSQIGPYKLLEQIGEGGMGIVYVAEQTQPVRRRVALKVIKPGMDSKQVIARFEAERQALAMMDHPNIARVLDAGTTENSRPFFVMELVRGLPITEYCDKARLNPRKRLELFITVCQAVQHAHQKGIIHRDLKPSNVMVTLHDGTPVVKVIDFGVAKAMGQQLTERTIYTAHTQLVGTPLYMSPEQAELSGLDVDTRSDVYSLGVLLYELLTGQTPFDKETLSKAGFDEMRRMIREDEPPRPSQRISTLNAQVSSTISQSRSLDDRQLTRVLRGELDWIVMKSLEKDRNRRYESASALAADIQRYLNDEPVHACPPSTAYRLRMFVRRNKSSVAISCAVTICLVIATTLSAAAYWRRVRESRLIWEAVDRSMASAKTAVEAGDLNLAGQYLTQTQGRLGESQRQAIPDKAAAIDQFAAELEARKDARERLAKFQQLARDGQTAREALAVFNIVGNPRWRDHLDQMFLTAEEKKNVIELAYQTTITWAHSHCHYSSSLGDEPQHFRKALEILEQALSFHEPTRVYWLVRRAAHRALNEMEAAAEDDRQFQTAIAKSPMDYCLPGHFAAWDGDFDEAIRCYQAALRLQPDHYEAMSFLAYRMTHPRVNRLPEAIAYYRACLAQQPEQIGIYRVCSSLYEKLGQFNEAEAELNRNVELQKTDFGKAIGLYTRRGFYNRRGRLEEARQDNDRMRTSIENAANVCLKDAATSPAPINWLALRITTDPDWAPRDLRRALTLAQESVKRKPSNADYHYTLGVSLYYVGDWQQAISELEGGRRIDDHNRVFNYLFEAMAHARLGKDVEARKRLTWALETRQSHRKTAPGTEADEDFLRFRSEALSVVGVDEPLKLEELPKWNMTYQIGLFRALVVEFPDNADYKNRLANLEKLQAQHFGKKQDAPATSPTPSP